MKLHSIGTILLLCTLTSCVSTRRYTSFTKEKITKLTRPVPGALPGNITIHTDSLHMPDSLVTVQKLRSFFIPALLYWHSEQQLKCELSPSVPVKFFRQDLSMLEEAYHLDSLLGGRTLELSVVDIPHQFLYTHKEMVVMLIVAYATSGLEAIYPGHEDLMVGYRLMEHGRAVKSGVITVPNAGVPVQNIWKSTKKFTWEYLSLYRRACREMSQAFMEQLLDEINN